MTNQDLFRTIVKVENAEVPIDTGSGVLFMGSCFAGNIGRFMVETRFPAQINPFGVLYNPISLLHAFDHIMQNRGVSESDLYLLNDLWHSFHHHGKFSHPDPSETVRQIKEATLNAHLFLEKVEFVIVTFGTAYVYQHKKLQQVVANCHKFPDHHFSRYLLDPDEIVEEWKELIIRIRLFNPHTKFIFTLSPVRHWKDGAHGNQMSKSTLLLAIEKLTALFDKAWYFPAYEIVLDELRDYRFYQEDMLQPNEVAINYIWKRFMESQLSHEAQCYYREAQKIQRARLHRHSGHHTASFRKFVQQTIEQINSLSARYPASLIEKEKVFFEKLL